LLLAVLVVVAVGPVVAGQPGLPGARTALGRVAPRAKLEVGGGATAIHLPLVTREFAPGYVSPFGVTLYYDVNAAEGLEQIEAAGARWTSTYFRWKIIEPNPPAGEIHTYNWTEFDTKAANASAAGVSIYTMFSWNPAWAAYLPGGPVTNTANLLAVAAAAAERYDGDGLDDAPGHPVVNHWAFYMEPDNYWAYPPNVGDRGFWGDQPEAYADLLAQLANVMHAANPDAVIMPGAVAYDFFAPPDGNGSFKRDFLGKVIDRLNVIGGGYGAAANYIDAVPFNYYPISPGLWSDIHEKATEIRGIMSARGVGHLPLLSPEMGYWSDATGPNEPPGSTPDLQARRLVQMYTRGLSAGLAMMNWFAVFDGSAGLEAHGLFFAQDLNQPKPAYTALQVLAREMTGAYYTGPAHAAGIEGYAFSIWQNDDKWVVWATQSNANATFPLSCLRQVDYLGNTVYPITDGSGLDHDGAPGQITLQVSENLPLFVEGC
jgi:hypothetical protein